MYTCVAGYALSRVIYRIQSEIMFHENPNPSVEWAGAGECTLRAWAFAALAYRSLNLWLSVQLFQS